VLKVLKFNAKINGISTASEQGVNFNSTRCQRVESQRENEGWEVTTPLNTGSAFTVLLHSIKT